MFVVYILCLAQFSMVYLAIRTFMQSIYYFDGVLISIDLLYISI